MKFDLGNGYTLSSKERGLEFKKAVVYLLKTFPPKRYMKFLTVTFYKGEMVSPAAVADYGGVKEMPHLDATIRVAYGKTGKDKDTFNRLFHEYKHLLQDDAGYLYDPKFAHINHCIEAQAWADEQEPIYRKWLEACHG